MQQLGGTPSVESTAATDPPGTEAASTPASTYDAMPALISNDDDDYTYQPWQTAQQHKAAADDSLAGPVSTSSSSTSTAHGESAGVPTVTLDITTLPLYIPIEPPLDMGATGS